MFVFHEMKSSFKWIFIYNRHPANERQLKIFSLLLSKVSIFIQNWMIFSSSESKFNSNILTKLKVIELFSRCYSSAPTWNSVIFKTEIHSSFAPVKYFISVFYILSSFPPSRNTKNHSDLAQLSIVESALIQIVQYSDS